jgi:vacuolar protein sorting-associated protein 35
MTDGQDYYGGGGGGNSLAGGQSVGSTNNFTSPMGGSLGDGAWNQPPPPQQQQGTIPGGGGGGGPYNNSNSMMHSPLPPNNNNNNNVYGGGGNMYGNTTPGRAPGSITQYATPVMQQQQQQQAMYNPPQNSPYNFTPPPQPANTAGMTFAQRSAMMQQQQGGGGGGGFYGGQAQQQQQQQPQPPVTQINVPQPPPPQPQPANAYGGGVSYAQRSQFMSQSPQQPPQPQTNTYSAVPGGGSNAMYPPSTPPPQPQPQSGSIYGGYPQQQQQQQPQMNNSYMGTPQQGQQPQPQAQSMAGGSYAQRSAMMGQSQMQQPNQQQQQQPGMMNQPQQQPGYQQQQQLQQQPRNPLMDPPEVIAQQQRLLTDATRKVQEHAYYMKQAMERNDLPTVLDRASMMVGELGEHAHAHHHHQVHPPAPGATGSTTALSPKNYYELHLRALEELPTLEDYLLNLSQQRPRQQPPAQQQQQQQPPSPSGGMLPSPGNPLMMGGAPGATNQSMMMMNNSGMMNNPQMLSPQQQQYPQQQQQQQQLHYLPQPQLSYTMKELYDCVQYCPNVLSRLYLQICAASALIRSGEVGTRWVLKDMIEAVKCVQNPVRGLFLRHYLLQAFRDKLPDEPIPVDQIGAPLGTGTAAPRGENSNPVENVATPAPVVTSNIMNNELGTVKDSYGFILANFIEMNKLWVRIQHLPGDGKSIEVRRRREKDRNELRILVGTNLVRLSALDSITSAIYGQVILPTVLDHIVICADPLAQAYLMDCLVQVFPDEYHIETMPILLGVCPKLRDKVNIRTILQSLMDRLANYLADEELLDEKDSNQVKRSVALDSFRMFDECVQNVYNARGPKLNPKEVIRLQTALLSFSMKCYQGNMEQVTLCLKNCVIALEQARNNASYMQDPNMQQQQQAATPKALDAMSTQELEKLLSIPLDELALGVLNLDYYADLIAFLPWGNRRQVALTMLKSVSNAGKSPESVKEIDELFSVIAPVLRDEHDAAPVAHQQLTDGMERTANLMAGLGVSPQAQRYLSQSSYDTPSDSAAYQQDSALVSKLIDMLDNPDTDVLYEMLTVARNHLNAGKKQRVGTAYVALVFASLKLARRINQEENGTPPPEEIKEGSKDTAEEKDESTDKTDADGEDQKPAEKSQAEKPEENDEKEEKEEDAQEESKTENDLIEASPVVEEKVNEPETPKTIT